MNEAGDAVKHDSRHERWLYPCLRAFTIALTGSLQGGAELAQAALATLQTEPQGHGGPNALLLRAYRQAHTLWMQRAAQQSGEAGGRADPRCFALPANTPEAAARLKGLAQVIADLPPQQRATLLLIYGEGLSYDEVAEVFDTTVQVVMTRAVRGHIAVGHWLDRRRETMDADGELADADEDAPRAGQVA